MALAVLLAVFGAGCLVAGAAWLFPPAGLLVLGVACLVAAYVYRYFKVANR